MVKYRINGLIYHVHNCGCIEKEYTDGEQQYTYICSEHEISDTDFETLQEKRFQIEDIQAALIELNNKNNEKAKSILKELLQNIYGVD